MPTSRTAGAKSAAKSPSHPLARPGVMPPIPFLRRRTPAELQKILPHHEVHRLIGRGGMGAVCKGLQLCLDRAVAIKLLPPAIECLRRAL